MKANIFITSALLMLLTACGQKAMYRIEGKLGNLNNPVVYAVFESEDGHRVDTVTCKKAGQFKIEENQPGFQQATLFFNDRRAWFTVYLEPKIQVSLRGDLRYPELIQAKGGELNETLSDIRKKEAGLLKEKADLSRQMDATPSPDLSGETMTKLANVRHQLEEGAIQYIQKHPEEPASVVLLKAYFSDPDNTHRLDELLAALNPKLKDFYLVKDLEQYSARVKRTALGAKAPDFDVKNVYGKAVSLDSFPHKYVLLTFSAPWCEIRNPELYLNDIRKKYSAKQLANLLVSLDTDSKAVRKILDKDSLRWNLVTDSAGQATRLLDLYNVSSLPRSFLIDDKGKIILKTSNGMELKQTLEEVIK
ncbi:MAG: AhpC/TSA family protein [Tannerella sp.]|jgi:peroxiredoxin|nr:AhpC/TSA family protein [Tannerella sp.]